MNQFTRRETLATLLSGSTALFLPNESPASAQSAALAAQKMASVIR